MASIVIYIYILKIGPYIAPCNIKHNIYLIIYSIFLPGKPRPVSLPVESLLSATDGSFKPAAAGRKG